MVSRLFHAKDDKNQIAGWKLDFIRILQVFHVRPVCSAESSLTQYPIQTELAMDTHKVVTGIHRNMLAGQEGTTGQNHSVGGFASIN